MSERPKQGHLFKEPDIFEVGDRVRFKNTNHVFFKARGMTGTVTDKNGTLLRIRCDVDGIFRISHLDTDSLEHI